MPTGTDQSGSTRRTSFVHISLGLDVDPEIFARHFFAGQVDAFWLDGGPNGVSEFGLGRRIVGDDTLSEIDRERSFYLAAGDRESALRRAYVGWVPYGFARSTIGAELISETESQTAFIRAERTVRIDNRTGSVKVAVMVVPGGWSLDAWCAVVRDLVRRAIGDTNNEADENQSLAGLVRAIPADDDAQYISKIEECMAEISAGNAYVLCLSTRITVPGNWDDLNTFTALRRSSRSHHGALIRIGPTSLVSASPERFLEVSDGGWVSTHPIKGTRGRSAIKAEDLALKHQLHSSVKERAENLMIVDLMRNDLTRICEIGTVMVDRLFEVETYPQVHQLVSSVSGLLRRDVGVEGLLHATFPAGSMTGAPKAMAVRVLDRLEGVPRGLYAGCHGSIGLDGTVDLAMTIRGIVIDESGAMIGTGGGITALSVPVEELEEVHIKAQAALQSLRPRTSHRSLALGC